MLGYGLLNAKVHEICITGIIRNFLARSLFIIPQYYANLFEGKTSVDSIAFKDIKQLYDLFIKEEQKISAKESAEKSISSINDNVYKYILSSNIVKEKNYKFREKNYSQIIEDGKNNLETIFIETFKKFFNDEKLQEIFLAYDMASSLDDFDFQKELGSYFPEFSLTEAFISALAPILLPGVGAAISLAIITVQIIDELEISESDKIKLKKYKKLYEKLVVLHEAIRGAGTNEELIINTIKSMSAEERCYLCSKYPNYANGSMFKALEEDLDDTVNLLFTTVGEDGREKYLYTPLNCKQFGWSSKGGEEGLTYESIKLNGVCKAYFDKNTKYKLRAKELGIITGSGENENKENYKKLNESISNFLINEQNYILENKIFDSCYKFFKDNNFFLPRDTYLRLLNEQINALEV